MSKSKKSSKWFVRLVIYLFLILVYFTENNYRFLIKNVILAYIPFELSILSYEVNKKSLLCLITILWLLFYPNTFYMITDFTHLSAIGNALNNPYEYYHYGLLAMGIFIGIYLGLTSARLMCVRFIGHYDSKIKLGYHAVLSIISAAAIYFGRFVRIHSIDLLIDPMKTLKLILGSINGDFVIFVVVFATIQFIIMTLYNLNIVAEVRQERKDL